jgi:hypothetical protein
MAHRFFGLFLLFLATTAALVLSLNGWDYYSASAGDRVFMTEHRALRPSGSYSHGLGVIGATMISVGVALYSTRKRVRALWNLGKLSVWLEIHITLCLLGPILVLYHTTFKSGGIAAISLWTMLSVARSGIVGRFLYVLIPRTPGGGQLSRIQINEEFDRLSSELMTSEVGKAILVELDRRFSLIERPRNIMQTFQRFLQIQRLKSDTKHWVAGALKSTPMTTSISRQLREAAHARARLLQRTVLLIQIEKLFYYWHAIHLPFTVIMFITLAAHVGVAPWLGYTWIF